MPQPFGEPPDSAHPIPLTHHGCGGLLLCHVEIPAPVAGEILYAENVVRLDVNRAYPGDDIGPCPECGQQIAAYDVTWERG